MTTAKPRTLIVTLTAEESSNLEALQAAVLVGGRPLTFAGIIRTLLRVDAETFKSKVLNP